MDEREIDWKLYILNEERDNLLSSLEELKIQLKDETKTKEELEKLQSEYNDLIDDIHDIECDIAVYQEMLDKLYLNHEEEEVHRFDLHDEVFTDGDY